MSNERRLPVLEVVTDPQAETDLSDGRRDSGTQLSVCYGAEPRSG